MALNRRSVGNALYDSYKIGSLMSAIDQDYTNLKVSKFDLDKINVDFDISLLSGYERNSYWSTLDRKKRYEKRSKLLLKQYKAFIGKYRVSPILSFDENELKTGYSGKRRGHRVNGHFRFYLVHPEWFQALDIPKVPKRLTEVFA